MYKRVMFRVLEDAQLRPQIFCSFNAIPEPELNDWLRRADLVLPTDLVEFWRLTGGGDIFDSETILRPSVSTTPNASFAEDGIEQMNAAAAQEGKPADLYLFAIGTFRSAIRMSDQKYITLKHGGYIVDKSFNSFNQWYVEVLRAEFGTRYGLPI